MLSSLRSRRKWVLIGLAGWILVLAIGVLPPVVQAALLSTAESRDAPEPPPEPLKVFLPLVFGKPEVMSTYALIDKALAEGTIDAEMALTYKVFADFHDPRLPARFRGDDTAKLESTGIMALAREFDNLSSSTQETLVSFLVPPAYAGSWYNPVQEDPTAQSELGVIAPGQICTQRGLSGNWTHLPDGALGFRVWHPIQAPQDVIDEAYAVQAEMDRVWPLVTDLMGRVPLSDLGMACNGGTGLIDIFIYKYIPNDRYPDRPFAAPMKGSCPTPGYIVWPEAGLAGGGLPNIAHELMHLVMFSYAHCVPNHIQHPIAQWVIDYTDPFAEPGGAGELNFEQFSAEYFLNSPELPLTVDPDGRDYGMYLWPFYIANKVGVEKIPAIVDRIGSGTDPFQVLDNVLPGGLAERFNEFALYNWNQAPVDFYKQWDAQKLGITNVKNSALRTVHVNLNGTFAQRYALDVNIPPLSARYYRFVFDDPSARSVIFTNGLTPNASQASLQFLAHSAGGGWEIIQGNATHGRSFFCQDDPAKKIDELIVILTNTNWQDPAYVPQTNNLGVFLEANKTGCLRWEGTAEVTETRSNGMVYSHRATDLVLEFSGPPVIRGYRIVQGNLEINISGAKNGCTWSGGPYYFTISRPDFDGTLTLYQYAINSSGQTTTDYKAGGAVQYQRFLLLDAVQTCNGQPYVSKTYIRPVFTVAFQNYGEARPMYITKQGTLEDDYTYTYDTTEYHQSYAFSSPPP